MASSTVTIEKAYLSTLLRRSIDAAFDNTDGLPSITIPRSEYEALVKERQEYSALKQSLFSGGITQDTLNVLVGHAPGRENTVVGSKVSRTGSPAVAVQFDKILDDDDGTGKLFHMPETSLSTHRQRAGSHDQGAGYDNSYFTSNYGREDGMELMSSNVEQPLYALSPGTEKQHYTLREDRTVRLRNVSDHAQLSDILEHVRGGQVLDVCVRSAEKTASVSFVEGSAAHAFLKHHKRHDLYIVGKRVGLSWNDRQFILPGHVAGKIRTGATRNVVIRNAQQSFFTEQRIRSDLEHIHNLTVVEVTHEFGDLYISLNSVHNALYARSCMLSRTMYKGKRIDFYPDECANPFPDQPNRLRQTPVAIKKLNPLANRFQMLNLEGTEDGSETDDGVDAGTQGF